MPPTRSKVDHIGQKIDHMTLPERKSNYNRIRQTKDKREYEQG